MDKRRLECIQRADQADMLNPELIVVSTLHRTIQNAVFSFLHHLMIPWMAHEDAREQHGLLYCNNWRSVTETRKEFPNVDFSALESDRDVIWLPEACESPANETACI